MSDTPNYRKLAPPDDKDPEEYTWAERRAELYDMIERAGHYRNLERSQRELGDHYGVSHTTIQNDIQAVLTWQKAHLGNHAEGELETLKTKAIQELIDAGDFADAYDLMRKHYQTLMKMGRKDSKTEHVAVDARVEEASAPTLADEDRELIRDFLEHRRNS